MLSLSMYVYIYIYTYIFFMRTGGWDLIKNPTSCKGSHSLQVSIAEERLHRARFHSSPSQCPNATDSAFPSGILWKQGRVTASGFASRLASQSLTLAIPGAMLTNYMRSLEVLRNATLDAESCQAIV